MHHRGFDAGRAWSMTGREGEHDTAILSDWASHGKPNVGSEGKYRQTLAGLFSHRSLRNWA
jgi:hypothetical protein